MTDDEASVFEAISSLGPLSEAELSISVLDTAESSPDEFKIEEIDGLPWLPPLEPVPVARASELFPRFTRECDRESVRSHDQAHSPESRSQDQRTESLPGILGDIESSQAISGPLARSAPRAVPEQLGTSGFRRGFLLSGSEPILVGSMPDQKIERGEVQGSVRREGEKEEWKEWISLSTETNPELQSSEDQDWYFVNGIQKASKVTDTSSGVTVGTDSQGKGDFNKGQSEEAKTACVPIGLEGESIWSNPLPVERGAWEGGLRWGNEHATVGNSPSEQCDAEEGDTIEGNAWTFDDAEGVGCDDEVVGSWVGEMDEGDGEVEEERGEVWEGGMGLGLGVGGSLVGSDSTWSRGGSNFVPGAASVFEPADASKPAESMDGDAADAVGNAARQSAGRNSTAGGAFGSAAPASGAAAVGGAACWSAEEVKHLLAALEQQSQRVLLSQQRQKRSRERVQLGVQQGAGEYGDECYEQVLQGDGAGRWMEMDDGDDVGGTDVVDELARGHAELAGEVDEVADADERLKEMELERELVARWGRGGDREARDEESEWTQGGITGETGDGERRGAREEGDSARGGGEVEGRTFFDEVAGLQEELKGMEGVQGLTGLQELQGVALEEGFVWSAREGPEQGRATSAITRSACSGSIVTTGTSISSKSTRCDFSFEGACSFATGSGARERPQPARGEGAHTRPLAHARDYAESPAAPPEAAFPALCEAAPRAVLGGGMQKSGGAVGAQGVEQGRVQRGKAQLGPRGGAKGRLRGGGAAAGVDAAVAPPSHAPQASHATPAASPTDEAQAVFARVHPLCMAVVDARGDYQQLPRVIKRLEEAIGSKDVPVGGLQACLDKNLAVQCLNWKALACIASTWLSAPTADATNVPADCACACPLFPLPTCPATQAAEAEARLGTRDSQQVRVEALRAVRLLVDVGMHMVPGCASSWINATVSSHFHVPAPLFSHPHAHTPDFSPSLICSCVLLPALFRTPFRLILHARHTLQAHTPDALAFFLPGILSGLSRATLSPFSPRSNEPLTRGAAADPSAVAEALLGLSQALVLVMGDAYSADGHDEDKGEENEEGSERGATEEERALSMLQQMVGRMEGRRGEGRKGGEGEEDWLGEQGVGSEGALQGEKASGTAGTREGAVILREECLLLLASDEWPAVACSARRLLARVVITHSTPALPFARPSSLLPVAATAAAGAGLEQCMEAGCIEVASDSLEEMLDRCVCCPPLERVVSSAAQGVCNLLCTLSHAHTCARTRTHTPLTLKLAELNRDVFLHPASPTFPAPTPQQFLSRLKNRFLHPVSPTFPAHDVPQHHNRHMTSLATPAPPTAHSVPSSLPLHSSILPSANLSSSISSPSTASPLHGTTASLRVLSAGVITAGPWSTAHHILDPAFSARLSTAISLHLPFAPGSPHTLESSPAPALALPPLLGSAVASGESPGVVPPSPGVPSALRSAAIGEGREAEQWRQWFWKVLEHHEGRHNLKGSSDHSGVLDHSVAQVLQGALAVDATAPPLLWFCRFLRVLARLAAAADAHDAARTGGVGGALTARQQPMGALPALFQPLLEGLREAVGRIGEERRRERRERRRARALKKERVDVEGMRKGVEGGKRGQAGKGQGKEEGVRRKLKGRRKDGKSDGEKQGAERREVEGTKEGERDLLGQVSAARAASSFLLAVSEALAGISGGPWHPPHGGEEVEVGSGAVPVEERREEEEHRDQQLIALAHREDRWHAVIGPVVLSVLGELLNEDLWELPVDVAQGGGRPVQSGAGGEWMGEEERRGMMRRLNESANLQAVSGEQRFRKRNCMARALLLSLAPALSALGQSRATDSGALRRAFPPLLRSLASPHARVSSAAAHALAFISRSFGYPSVAALVAANMDYAIATVCAGLSTLHCHPSAPRLLLALMHLLPLVPATPATPATPVVPVAPATPATPVVPVAPATPATPVVPAAPATPATPAAPVVPAAPALPVEHAAAASAVPAVATAASVLPWAFESMLPLIIHPIRSVLASLQITARLQHAPHIVTLVQVLRVLMSACAVASSAKRADAEAAASAAIAVLRREERARRKQLRKLRRAKEGCGGEAGRGRPHLLSPFSDQPNPQRRRGSPDSEAAGLASSPASSGPRVAAQGTGSSSSSFCGGDSSSGGADSGSARDAKSSADPGSDTGSEGDGNEEGREGRNAAEVGSRSDGREKGAQWSVRHALVQLSDRTRAVAMQAQLAAACLEACGPLMASRDAELALLAADVAQASVAAMSAADVAQRARANELEAVREVVRLRVKRAKTHLTALQDSGLSTDPAIGSGAGLGGGPGSGLLDWLEDDVAGLRVDLASLQDDVAAMHDTEDALKVADAARDETNWLLPRVHMIWPHAVSGLKRSHPALIISSVHVITALSTTCDDAFMARKIREDSWPLMAALLLQGPSLPSSSHSSPSSSHSSLPSPFLSSISSRRLTNPSPVDLTRLLTLRPVPDSGSVALPSLATKPAASSGSESGFLQTSTSAVGPATFGNRTNSDEPPASHVPVGSPPCSQIPHPTPTTHAIPLTLSSTLAFTLLLTPTLSLSHNGCIAIPKSFPVHVSIH
ncbi:unnamed protein product [Closterium sp. Yama58-4]|nr:unnamed protein product [Closterium sp. Yama58-4]